MSYFVVALTITHDAVLALKKRIKGELFDRPARPQHVGIGVAAHAVGDAEPKSYPINNVVSRGIALDVKNAGFGVSMRYSGVNATGNENAGIKSLDYLASDYAIIHCEGSGSKKPSRMLQSMFS